MFAKTKPNIYTRHLCVFPSRPVETVLLTALTTARPSNPVCGLHSSGDFFFFFFYRLKLITMARCGVAPRVEILFYPFNEATSTQSNDAGHLCESSRSASLELEHRT